MHAARLQLRRAAKGPQLRIALVGLEGGFCNRSYEARQGAAVQISSSQSSPYYVNSSREKRQTRSLRNWPSQQTLTPWDNLWRAFSTNTKPGLNKEGFFEIPLAQTGEGIAECEVLKWNVKEGQEVQQFDLLCEVQSDKASVEITSRYAGTIRKIYFQPGDIVKVGETLCDLTPPGGQSAPATSSEEPVLATSYKAAASGPSATSPKHIATADDTSRNKASASPAVRALAREYGLDLSQVMGTGPDGRVLKGDVLRFVAVSQGVEETREAGGATDVSDEAPGHLSGSAATSAHGHVSGSAVTSAHGHVSGSAATSAHGHVSAPETSAVRSPVETRESVGGAASEGDRVVPLRGYRRAMAKSMAAANEVPHFTFCEEIDMDRLVELRARLQSDAAAASGGVDVKLTYMPFMLKALSTALREFPEVNATVNDEVTDLTCRGSHNIGVAMATPHGLVVPNVKDCQNLNVKQIATEMQRLQGLAKAGRLSERDVTGGTITVSNVGSIGGTYATPLINLPEVAIVALGKVQTLPRYRSGELRPVPMMQVSWSADHRVIDGASVAHFCQVWKRYVENPDSLLLHLR